MKYYSKLLAIMVLVGLCTIVSEAADTWYVDDNNYNESYADAAAYIADGFDGSTEAKAFGTIQAAIDAETTKAGDTIVVLPGTYDQGGRELTWNSGASSAGLCRVVITKNKLIIRSRDGAATTHIVGRKADTESGNGRGAIRCVGQYQNFGVQLRGFTLRNGATDDSSLQVKYGGALYSQANNSDFAIYLIDSVITNCSGVSSITRNGTIARTFIAENQISGDGASVASGTQFYSCVFTRNKGYILIGSATKAVHCTLVGNLTKYATTSDVSLYNSIISLSHSSDEFNGDVPVNSAGNVTEIENGIYQTIAPLLDDYRLIKGATAESVGDSKYTSAAEVLTAASKNHFPSDIENKDFWCRDIKKEGIESVMAGAVAESVEIAGGAIAFDKLNWTSRVVVNGIRSCKDGIYAYPVKYPVQWRVTPELSTGKLFCWSTSADHGYAHFADTNDIAYLMPPPNRGVVMTNSLLLANAPVWLSPDGDDTTGDGSFDKPYQTLVKGVEAAGRGNRLIYCKRGTYNKGEVVAGGRTNRVYLNDQSARFVAVDGKEVTFIEGEASKTDTGEVATQGCGTDAIAGIYVNERPRVCFIGFTFRNCHTDAGSGGNLKAQGAVVRAAEHHCTSLIDCNLVGNSAVRGIAYGVKLIRCNIINNSTKEALLRDSLAFGCKVSNNVFVQHTSAMGYNCTYLNESPVGNCFACVGVNGENVPSALSYVGSIFYNYTTSNGTGYSKEDPLMIGDLDGRVSSRSPAYLCGVKPNDASDVEGASYYKVADYALDGVPLTISDDGKPMAGAYQQGVKSAITVKAINGGLSIANGTSAIFGEDKLEITAGNPGSRPCFGYTINGVTNYFDETPSRTLTSANVLDLGGIEIEALYQPHWYVSESGDDANTGFTPKTAKKTLAAACSIADLEDGDTIHAAAGTYAEQSVLIDGHEIRSRVSVRSNTTLVADDGPECTFIVGEPASGTVDGDETRNCGERAMRCVYLNANATIKGFTLTGGRTRCRTGNYYSSDDSGGGILGVNSSSCVGENLIISNNASYRGGAGRYVTLKKCRIYDNLGFNKGAVGSESAFFSCVADNNIGPDQVYYYRGIADCTFGANNIMRNGDVSLLPGEPSKTGYVSNTITRCKAEATNVYMRTYCTQVNGTKEASGLIVVDESNLQLDDELRPIIGKNVAIDQAVGDVAAVPNIDYDVLGGKRVYNGARDCGALEADWRECYGNDISSRFTVQSVSSDVVEHPNNIVRVPAGALLEGAFHFNGSQALDVYFSFVVSEGGNAKLIIGENETSFEGGTHEVKISVVPPLTGVRFEVGSGYVDILKAKLMKGFIITVK